MTDFHEARAPIRDELEGLLKIVARLMKMLSCQGYLIEEQGMVVPTGTPKAIVNRLHGTIVQILRSPQAQERYANIGTEIRYNTPEEFQALIRSEIAKWAKVVKAAGIRADQ